MFLRVGFKRITRPTCSETIKYDLDWSTLYNLKVYVDGELVASVEDATVLHTSAGVVADPDNADILLIPIDLLNIWDKATVQIIAHHVEGNGDFNDDFNDDFSIDYINKYEYINTFTVFGYDLGNNGVITHNPDFTINFLVNSLGELGSPEFMLTDFNEDFSNDFATFCNCYSDFIAYRRPLTDNIYVYDSVSSWIEPEKNFTERKLEYYDENQCLLGTERNIVVCRNKDIKIYQKVLQYRLEQEGNDCGCGGSYTKVVDKSCFTEMRDIEHIKYKYCPITSTTEECKDCSECCEVIILQENEVRTYLDINPMTTYWVDDVEENLYKKIRVIYEVITHAGYLYGATEIEIDSSVVEFYWNTEDSLWNYTIPEMGDFVLRTTVEFLGDEDVKAIKCVNDLKLKSCHWYEVKQVGCNEYEIFNHSFEDIYVRIDELQEIDEWLTVDILTIPKLSSVKVVHEKDGVFTYNLQREGTDGYTYIVINYCKLRECLLKKVLDGICQSPVGKCEEIDYYNFNVLAIHMHTYFMMLVEEYNFNYIYTSLMPNKIKDLYSIKEFMQKFSKYCGNCPKAKNCGCGCS